MDAAHPHPPITPWLLVLGAILAGLALHVAPGPLHLHPLPATLFLIGASLAWLVALEMARRGFPGYLPLVAGALVLRLVAAWGGVQLSDDVYRYVWEGELTLHGVSPYAHAPGSGDEELLPFRERLAQIHARVNNPSIPAAYPPTTQLVCAAVVAVAHRGPGPEGLRGVAGMRVFFALCDLLVLVPLVILSRRAGLGRGPAVGWAWSPLVALEYSGSGHFDSLGILLLLWALVLGGHGRDPSDGALTWRERAFLVLLAVATLVKLLPALALPFALRGRPLLRSLAWFLGTLACLYVPVLLTPSGAQGLFEGLSAYLIRWEGGSLVFRWVDDLVRSRSIPHPQVVGRVIVGLVWLAWVVRAWRRGASPTRGTGLAIGALLVLTPILHPWYLTWALPFALLRPGWAWPVLVALAPLLYMPLVGWRTQGLWEEPAWVWWTVAPLFFGLLVVDSRGDRGEVGGP